MSGRTTAPEPGPRSREVSRPDGPDERAAEHIATHHGPAPASAEAAFGPTDTVGTTPLVDQVLSGAGRPLEDRTRTVMQHRLRHDLGSIRIHSGADASAAVQSLGAVAFTVGRHVVLGAAASSPDTAFGRRLLAHELTHTVQGAAPGQEAVIRRAVQVPETQAGVAPGFDVDTLPVDQTERIIRRLEEFVTASDHPETDAETARRVASYLVTEEQLDRAGVVALFAQLQERMQPLMRSVAFGGHVFHELRKLGVVDLTVSALWYLGETVVDTLAGDFVQDPTALAVVLRTLLTLIPGIDQVADVEDLLGNLFHGVTDPGTNLWSIGWWFSVVLSLIGLFPSVGSAVKGGAKLVVTGIGSVAGPALDVLSAAFRRLLGEGWMPTDLARSGVDWLLAKGAEWGPWVLAAFGEFLNRAIEHLTVLTSKAGGALLSLLATLNQMKNLAIEWIPRAVEEVKRLLRDLRDGLLGSTDEAALKGGDDLDEVTQILDRGRRLDPALAEQRVAEELSPTNPVVAEDLRRFGQAPNQSAAQDVLGMRTKLDAADQKFLADVAVQTQVITKTFADPSAFAKAVRVLQERIASLTDGEIADEAERLAAMGVRTGLQRETAAYSLAIRQQAEQMKTGVIEIISRKATNEVVLITRSQTGAETVETLTNMPDGVLPNDEFMARVIRTGNLIVDHALLGSSHSAIAHVVQEMAADDALKGLGYAGSTAYRRSLGEVHDLFAGLTFNQSGVGDVSAGSAFWVAAFDTFGGIGTPEILGAAIRRALELPLDEELRGSL